MVNVLNKITITEPNLLVVISTLFEKHRLSNRHFIIFETNSV